MYTIGRGSTCKVKLAFDTERCKDVAIKMLNDGLSPKAKELYEREVYHLEHLPHSPHLVQMLDHGQDYFHSTKKPKKSGHIYFIVLQHAVGRNLLEILESGGAFDEAVARHYFK